MAHEIKGDELVRGHLRSRSLSLESLKIETVTSSVYQLNASSPSQIFFEGYEPGQYINLGSALDYEIGHIYKFMNDSSETVVIRDYNLNLIYALPPSAAVSVTLKENGSAEGLWFVETIPLSSVTVDLEGISGFGGSDAQTFIENYLALAGIPVKNETPIGAIDCQNLDFQTFYEFIPGSLEVFLSGIKLDSGIDYVESLNAQGFTVIIDAENKTMLNRAPMDTEQLRVNYSRRVIFS